MEPTAVGEKQVAKQQCGKYSHDGECRMLAGGAVGGGQAGEYWTDTRGTFKPELGLKGTSWWKRYNSS